MSATDDHDCGYNGDLYLCINGQVYGPCENENCGGVCEIERDCDCACHGRAVRLTDADLADIRMGGEMFDASPDGRAEAERRQAWLDSLPRGTIQISGEWDRP